MKSKETKQNKTFAQNQNHNNKKASITKDSFLKNCVYKYFTGEREQLNIRIDSGVKKRFKPLAKRLYGSICRSIEIYMVTLIELAENPASICYTNGKPIQIEKIVIERNLRPRRRLEVDDDFGLDRCHYCVVKKLAVGKFRYLKSGEVYGLCSFHAETLLGSGNWERVKDE